MRIAIRVLQKKVADSAMKDMLLMKEYVIVNAQLVTSTTTELAVVSSLHSQPALTIVMCVHQPQAAPPATQDSRSTMADVFQLVLYEHSIIMALANVLFFYF